MKKFLSMALALAMAAALAVPAMATSGTAETITTSGSALDNLNDKAEISVTADVSSTSTDTAPIVYYVVVDWTTKSPKWEKGTTVTYTWNGATKAYTSDSSSSTDKTAGSVEVTVTNYSNANVTATLAYAQENISGVTGAWTDDETYSSSGSTIATIVSRTDFTKTSYSADTFNSAKYQCTLTPGDTTPTNGAVIGKVTVNISAA